MANDGTGLTSVGLMGLPHFKTSRVSMEMYEPVYLNLFTVEFQLPKGLTGTGGVSDDDKNLLLEGVQVVDGLDTNKVPGATLQHYKFADRSFANSGTDQTYIDVKLDFEINLRGSAAGTPDMYTLKILRRWNDLIWDPITGRQGLKVNYVAPTVTVTMHDKANQPFWQWTLYNVFPTTNLPIPTLDYSNKNTLYKVTGYTLRCDYWDEVML
jgi:hypothetical protein